MDHVVKCGKYHSCNGHWEPQYMHCDYCNIRYDVIGRLEYLENYLEYISIVNNFNSDLNFIKDDLHMHQSGTKKLEKPIEMSIRKNGTIGKTEKTKSYFKQLTTTQLKNIYHMYKIDFEMFGYSPEPYHP